MMKIKIISFCCLIGLTPIAFATEIESLFENKKKESFLLLEKREKLGDYFLKVLKDEKSTLKQKVISAQELTRMKYTKAIPSLIENISLREADLLLQEASVDNLHPIVKVLSDFGVDAIPELARAYIEEKGSRKTLLKFALCTKKNRLISTRYLVGLEKELKNNKDLLDLIKFLQSE